MLLAGAEHVAGHGGGLGLAALHPQRVPHLLGRRLQARLVGHRVEAGEARHAGQAVVHLVGLVVLAERRAQRPPALHLHLLRRGDAGGGVRVDGAARHAHAPHPPHAAHAAHVEVGPGRHAGGHGGGQEGLPLPALGGGALQHVLRRELVLRVHPHLVHVGQQAWTVR